MRPASPICAYVVVHGSLEKTTEPDSLADGSCQIDSNDKQTGHIESLRSGRPLLPRRALTPTLVEDAAASLPHAFCTNAAWLGCVQTREPTLTVAWLCMAMGMWKLS